jgi:hypothetical protein
MSALVIYGLWLPIVMSALPPKADIDERKWHVR